MTRWQASPLKRWYSASLTPCIEALVPRVTDRRPQGVQEPGVPLRAEAGAAVIHALREARVVLQVLGDGDLAGEALADVLVQLLQEAPAVVQLGGARGVVAQELAHLGPAVVGARVAPGGAGALVIVEVDTAQPVALPAVEAPQVEGARSKVVVDDVEDHRDAALVALAHEGLEAARPAVGALDGE